MLVLLVYENRYLTNNPDDILLFVTTDSPGLIYSLSKESGVSMENIRVTKSTREKMPLYLSIATIGFYSIKPAYSKKASSATKMGEMLAMGLPIITNSGVGDSDHIIKKYRCGRVANPDDEVFPDFNAYDKELSYKAAYEYFDLKKGVLQYSESYKWMENEQLES